MHTTVLKSGNRVHHYSDWMGELTFQNPPTLADCIEVTGLPWKDIKDELESARESIRELILSLDWDFGES